MIFFETFANALDAGATDFSVNIELSNKEDIENLTLIIADNGVGFTDHRFSELGKLFSEDFANKSEVIEVPKHTSGTTLRMSLFPGKRVVKWKGSERYRTG